MRKILVALLAMSAVLVSCYDFESEFSRQTFLQLGAFTEAQQARHLELPLADYRALLDVLAALEEGFDSDGILDISPAEIQETIVLFHIAENVAQMMPGFLDAAQEYLDMLEELGSSDVLDELAAVAARLVEIWGLDDLWGDLFDMDLDGLMQDWGDLWDDFDWDW